MTNSLESSWLNILQSEFEKEYMKNLKTFLLNQKEHGFTIYPKNSDIFNALNTTPFDSVKVVILGQDPYHGAGQAHGLSFSVQKGVVVPPSLKNIYKELESDIESFKTPNHGNLTQWAEQGVLLLNATLTVNASSPGSHQKQGWETFTDTIIKSLSDKKDKLVFILWGKFAQQKTYLIDQNKHFILSAAHPSPFSAYNGFFGSKPFSATNKILEANHIKPIDWKID